MTDFSRRVGVVCRAIPPGKVATYGQIALLCGRPQCPRQVGTVLNRESCGEVPAHRVVDRRGYLSGARAFLGPDIQRLSLLAEGVEVSSDLFVDLERYGWRPGPEEQAALAEALLREDG